MRYIYDDEADALYVYLREGESVARSEIIDEGRVVDFGQDGQPVGIELLSASAGVQVSDLATRYELWSDAVSLRRLERTDFIDP